MVLPSRNFQIIDVTFRDGGHHNQFRFDRHLAKELLSKLEDANIDYIEIGYRNGFLNAKSKLGEAAYCQNDFISYCQSILKKSKLSVMLHPTLVTKKDLEALDRLNVPLVRFCVGVGELSEMLPIIKQARQYRFAISINLTHCSQYTIDSLINEAKKAEQLDIDMLYFADSNGSLLFDRVKELISSIHAFSKLKLGFHAHDNIGLAQMNTILAISHGATMIDCSLLGLGKGIGNLKSSFFVSYLLANSYRNLSYQLKPLVDAESILQASLNIPRTVGDLDEFRRGIEDLSTAQLKRIKSHSA